MTVDNQTLSLVDIQKIKAAEQEPGASIKTFQMPQSIEDIVCDILIVGGGTAGVAAAVSATASGDLNVCLTEETDWLGGQMTSQGVPITDDGRNFEVETSGANRSYQKLRQSIRNHYLTTYKLSAHSEKQRFFNPGNCWYWVSQLTFEPAVAVAAIEQILAPAKSTGKLKVYARHLPVSVERSDDHIEAVRMVDLDSGKFLNFKAKYFIDATEWGELLALGKVPFTCGVESRAETGEPSAPEKARHDDVQDFTYPFIVEFQPGANHTIEKPALYDDFNKQGKFSLLNYKMFGHGNKTNQFGVIVKELMPFWTYRRILDKSAFEDDRIKNDVAVINWYSNDLQGHNVIGKEPSVVSRNLGIGKALSLGFLYWLQTEAPRDEGGKGYPELRLVVDALGTDDGLSKYPYVRESRRGKAITVIKEQDIKPESGASARANLFDDSVGIGFFPIDIHGQNVDPGTLRATKPFQFPLGALLLNKPSNLILSCKNIGATHITSAAYRLHPIEWGIGEASGALCAFAIERKIRPQVVLEDAQIKRQFQFWLIAQGIPLYWYDDVPTSHPYFEAAQLLAILDILRGDAKSLSFNPDATISDGEAHRTLNKAKATYSALSHKLDEPMKLATRGEFAFWLYNQIKKSVFDDVLKLSASQSNVKR